MNLSDWLRPDIHSFFQEITRTKSSRENYEREIKYFPSHSITLIPNCGTE